MSLDFTYNEKEVILPSGYTDPEGVLHKEVVIRELSGEEEEILLNADSSKNGQLLNKILDKVAKLKNRPELKFVESLLLTDQLFLLVQARALSFGKDYKFGLDCPQCKTKANLSVDLESLEFVGAENPALHETVELPNSKVQVKFKKHQGKDQANLSKLMNNGGADKINQLLLYRIQEVRYNDQVIDKTEALKKVPASDRKFIREYMAKSEGSAETAIDYQCVNCSHKMTIPLPIDENFFCLGQQLDA